MSIEISEVKHLKISDVSNLDLINVYLENIKPGEGRILIECYGKSWTSYWQAMSGNRVEEFFIQCDNLYLTDRLDVNAKGHKLKYLIRIVEAVKSALKEINHREK